MYKTFFFFLSFFSYDNWVVAATQLHASLVEAGNFGTLRSGDLQHELRDRWDEQREEFREAAQHHIARCRDIALFGPNP